MSKAENEFLKDITVFRLKVRPNSPKSLRTLQDELSERIRSGESPNSHHYLQFTNGVNAREGVIVSLDAYKGTGIFKNNDDVQYSQFSAATWLEQATNDNVRLSSLQRVIVIEIKNPHTIDILEGLELGPLKNGREDVTEFKRSANPEVIDRLTRTPNLKFILRLGDYEQIGNKVVEDIKVFRSKYQNEVTYGLLATLA